MEKKPLYYIQTIGGYKNKNELLKAIGEYEEAGFVVAVDASNKERIYSPQTKSGSWKAVLIKVKDVAKEETWEEYELLKTPQVFISLRKDK